MARKRVADVLVDMLVAAGVKRVYGLVGDSLNSEQKLSLFRLPCR